MRAVKSSPRPRLAQWGSYGAAALVVVGFAWSPRTAAQASVDRAAATIGPDIAVPFTESAPVVAPDVAEGQAGAGDDTSAAAAGQR